MTRLTQLFGVERPVALVTGSGAKRVGETIARTFARRGYDVVLHANRSMREAETTVAELRAAGGDAACLQADLSDPAAVEKLVEQAFAWRGRLDVLVNAAAVWKAIPLEEITPGDVGANFNVNTLATFVAGRAAGLRMVGQSHGGAIVNIGDWAVARPYLHHAHYFASKGSIDTITRTLAVELAARNPRVRVNAVSPGPVMLPPDLPPEEREQAIAGTLVKREGTPAHVADAVLFLVENDFVTGVSLPVDGGRTIRSQ